MRTLVMMDYATKAKRLVQLQGMQVWPTQYQFVVVLLRIVQIRNSLWLWQSRSVYFGNLLQFLNFEAISLTNTTVSLWVWGKYSIFLKQVQCCSTAYDPKHYRLFLGDTAGIVSLHDFGIVFLCRIIIELPSWNFYSFRYRLLVTVLTNPPSQFITSLSK